MGRESDVRVIIVTHYRKKAVLLAALILFQALMLLAGNFLMKNSLLMNITIDEYLEFSYPPGMEVGDILVSKEAQEVNIQSSSPLPAPIARRFTSYESLQGKFGFDYPSAFVIEPQEFGGADILYHIAFRSRTEADRGFVQVWNLPVTLEEFLESSLAASRQTYGYFRSGGITVNGVPGYYWDYSVLADGRYYKGNEVFLKKDGRMYRMSYFVPESDWNDRRAELFKNMVKSFKIL